jgi:hypothetical protein
MNKILLPLLLLFSASCLGQSIISSVNSGAVSNNNIVFSVGEIFVLPTSTPDEANSGLMGVLSRVEFFVTGLDEQLASDDTRAYPNPTSQSLFFSTTAQDAISEVFIFDNSGRLVATKTLANNKVDLSELQTGIYFIKPNKSDNTSLKIIKQ